MPHTETPIALLERAEWREAIKADPTAKLGLRKDSAGSRVRYLTTGEIKALGLEGEQPGEGYAFEWTLSTDRQDRDRDIIEVAGWRWDDFIRTGAGPVLLAHASWTVPIAKMPRVSKDSGALVGILVFPSKEEAEHHELAHCAREMIKFGALSAGSVGFYPLEWTFDEDIKGIRFKEQDLLEFSPCAVPSNADAVRRAKAAGINVGPLKSWAEQVLDQMAVEEKTDSALERVWKAAKGRRIFVETAEGLVPVERVLAKSEEPPAEAAVVADPVPVVEPEVVPVEAVAPAPADPLAEVAAAYGVTVDKLLEIAAEEQASLSDELYISLITPVTGQVPA